MPQQPGHHSKPRHSQRRNLVSSMTASNSSVRPCAWTQASRPLEDQRNNSGYRRHPALPILGMITCATIPQAILRLSQLVSLTATPWALADSADIVSHEFPVVQVSSVSIGS